MNDSTSDHDSASGGGSGKTSRRSFLRVIGAGGLASAGLLFGRAAPAAGSYCNEACCKLYTCENVSMSHCQSGANYTWYCQYTPTVYCQCCEHGGLLPYWDGHSSYECAHV